MALAGARDRQCDLLVDFIQHLMPPLGSGDDRLRIGLPDERLRLLVMDVDEGVDGALQVDEGVEDAVLQPSSRELGEEAFDGVQPRTGGGCEVEGPARVAGEPCLHLRVFVGGVVVEHDVDRLVRRHLLLDDIEELDEFLVPMRCRF